MPTTAHAPGKQKRIMDWGYIVKLGAAAGLIEAACSQGVAILVPLALYGNTLAGLGALVLLLLMGVLVFLVAIFPVRRNRTVLSALCTGVISFTLWFAWLWIYDSLVNPGIDHSLPIALGVYALLGIPILLLVCFITWCAKSAYRFS
jgi:hypothetical protein